MTVKQEGPLPTPRPSNKGTPQSENKNNSEPIVASKEKEPVTSLNDSTAEKNNTDIKENAES